MVKYSGTSLRLGWARIFPGAGGDVQFQWEVVVLGEGTVADKPGGLHGGSCSRGGGFVEVRGGLWGFVGARPYKTLDRFNTVNDSFNGSTS